MIVATLLRFAILIALILPNTSTAEDIALPGTIPSDIYEIDITYSESGPPSVAFRSDPPVRPMPGPFRPSRSTFDLSTILKTSKVKGNCHASTAKQSTRWTMKMRAHAGKCRTLIEFHAPAVLDVLSYATLTLQGRASAPMTISLVDTTGLEAPLAHLAGSFEQHLEMTPINQRLNPTHIAAIAIEGESRQLTVSLDRLVLERAPRSAVVPARKGFWVWDYQQAIGDAETIIEECRRAGATRLLVQMPHGDDPPDLWSSYARALAHIKSAGLEAFALDGYPEAIYDPTPLIEKVRRLRSLLTDDQWTGLQLDIEPYMLDRFSDPEDYGLYVRAVEQIKPALGPLGRLSIVMPFWFTEKTAYRRPLAFEIMDRADEIAVMSYRTDLVELQDITEPILRYGDAVNRPVWLAVETRPLPIDQQVTFVREERAALATAYLDRATRRLVLASPASESMEGFRVAHRITIRPERLTFARETRQTLHSSLTAILAFPHSSLGGVLIHDLAGYLSLKE